MDWDEGGACPFCAAPFFPKRLYVAVVDGSLALAELWRAMPVDDVGRRMCMGLCADVDYPTMFRRTDAPCLRQRSGLHESFASAVVASDNVPLLREMVRAFGARAVAAGGLKCLHCGYGPLWNDSCSERVLHHGQPIEEGVPWMDDACPRCGALTPNERLMDAWDGVADRQQ